MQSSLSQYVGFSGRARRSEYWWFALFGFIVSLVLDVIDAAVKTPIPALLVSIALLLPGIAVGFRRLHDTDRSAWWILIGLIPIVGSIILIVFICQDSTPGDNRYGPSAKYPQAGWGSPPQWAAASEPSDNAVPIA